MMNNWLLPLAAAIGMSATASEAQGVAEFRDLPPIPYFGLMAPLDRAEVFAPGIVSTVNTEIMISSSASLSYTLTDRPEGHIDLVRALPKRKTLCGNLN